MKLEELKEFMRERVKKKEHELDMATHPFMRNVIINEIKREKWYLNRLSEVDGL